MTRRRRLLVSAGAGLVAAGLTTALVVRLSGDAPAQPAAIAFERGDGINPAIYVMAADGASQRVLVPYGSEPRWSPGGRRLAFVVHSPPEDEAPPDELWIVAADGSDARRAARDGWIRALAWSPDGSRIAWVNAPGWPERDTISVVDLRTGARRLLASSVDRPQSVDWSPDGRELLTVDDGEIVAVDVASGRRRTILADVRATDAVWSPTGRRIAYTASADPQPFPGREHLVVRLSSSIFVANGDGSGVRRLTRGGLDFSPSWAPNGETIAFARWVPSRSSELPLGRALYSVSVGSARIERLTDDDRDREPDWRPRARLEPVLGIPPGALPEPSVRVPDVMSFDLPRAARAIEEAGLRPLASTPGQPEPSGDVVVQTPGPGSRVPPGTAVQLVSRSEIGAG